MHSKGPTRSRENCNDASQKGREAKTSFEQDRVPSFYVLIRYLLWLHQAFIHKLSLPCATRVEADIFRNDFDTLLEKLAYSWIYSKSERPLFLPTPTQRRKHSVSRLHGTFDVARRSWWRKTRKSRNLCKCIAHTKSTYTLHT